ncbi:MAG TPA: MFS transporter [Acidimicrobiales bacterium]|nr:MFS transporter [Acidimicrobiales bacterium]
MANSYAGAAALVIFSLVPYLALTASVLPLSSILAKGVGLSDSSLSLTIALSTGAYALGTVLAVQFAVHLPARRMLILYEILFVIASVLAAWAPTGLVFATGFVAQGLCTSLMLIAAVPPLVTRWPAKKMPMTAGIMNLCIFGAVAIGPSIGARLALATSWRPLFATVAGLSLIALLFSILTFEDERPQGHDAPWDLVAVSLATVGCIAAFYGAGKLQTLLSAGSSDLVPLLVGFICILGLVAYEALQNNPLMPVRSVATSVPLSGLCIALSASAAAFGLMELVLQALKPVASPGQVAWIFLPEFLGAIVVAMLFMALFRTRYTPLLALGGLLAIVAASGMFLAYLPQPGPGVALGAGLLGLGVGASVSPALFLVGFSLPNPLLQRLFALIELLRGVTAFLVAPILLFLAQTVSGSSAVGIEVGIWICLGVSLFGFVTGAALYGGGKRRLEVPDLERWQEVGEPAWASPPLLHRHGRHKRGAAGVEGTPAESLLNSDPAAKGVDEIRRRISVMTGS